MPRQRLDLVIRLKTLMCCQTLMGDLDIIVVMNSFNLQKYVAAALNLYAGVIPHVKHVIIVFGGCKVLNKTKVEVLFTEKMTVLSIAENLSDWNGFLGYCRAAPELVQYNKFLHVYLHDTCFVAPRFAEAMTQLNVIKEKCIENKWTFAHTYGLYNIGVCSQEFIISYGAEFDGLSIMPKDIAIKLEQGERVMIEDRQFQPLRAFGTTSLSSHTCDSDEFERGDSFFVNAFSLRSGRRFVSYLGSLGIYKAVGSQLSYFVPMWCTPTHHVHDSASFEYMQKLWKPCYIHLDGFDLPMSPWLPLPSLLN